jgi:diketogulonate reductase-like aldo/keto reductase
VALRWLVQQEGIAAIPRSSNAARVAENGDIFGFALTDEEMARIAALKPNFNSFAVVSLASRAQAYDFA